jgi:hypothetical protein
LETNFAFLGKKNRGFTFSEYSNWAGSTQLTRAGLVLCDGIFDGPECDVSQSSSAVVSVSGLRRVGAHQRPRAPTVPLEARMTATWNACSLGVVGGRKEAEGAGNASRAADGTGRRDWFGAVMRSGPLRCGQIALRRPSVP